MPAFAPRPARHEFVLAAANTNDGLAAAARAGGKTGARPPRLTTEQIEQAQQLYESGIPVRKIARPSDGPPSRHRGHAKPR